MEKTQLSAVIQDFDAMEKTLKDMHLILACIAYQQDDRVLSIPVASLESLPKTLVLDISVDMLTRCYVFKAVDTAENAATAIDTASDPV